MAAAWECPSLPMLSLPLKETGKTTFLGLKPGQAQECLVEKSLKGIGRVKNITISRLATRYYQGAQAEEMGKYGELIALLQLTVQKLNGITGKPPKGMGDMMKMARQNFAEHVTDKLAVAKRQNDQVYHDTVPPVETLELMSGADLVKPVTFHPTDPKNLGSDIFSRLIPMRAHEVASIFSEEKAKLMRSIMSSVEEKDEELQQYMRSLNVSEVEKIHEDSPTIPDNVLRLHQSLQGRAEEVRKLHASCQELLTMCKSVEEDFAALRETKEKDDEEEEKFQSEFGPRPESEVCSAMWKEMDNYHGYNLQALKSNKELKAMFDHHYPNLVLLTSPLASLKASLPKMTLMDTPAEDTRESERWQHLLEEVEKMTRQRQALVTRFRQEMSSDDITRNLVGHLGSDQEVFLEEHMRQFKELSTIIRQNLTAQDNILLALTEANAKKASTRQTVQEITQQQQAMFAGLVKSGGLLNLLQTKLREGIVFYQKLQFSVSRLRKRAAEECGARTRERQNIERQRKAAVPDVTPPTSPSSDPQPQAPPARPPKKAELAGKPLPPDHQNLHKLTTGSVPDGNTSVAGVVAPINAHQPAPSQQLDLQELQKVQLQQQQALLAGIGSPPPQEPPQLEPSHNPPQTVNALAPQSAVSQPAVAADAAAQALNSLQMLLQPSNATLPQQDLEPATSGGSGAAGVAAMPQRPPKPAHLKAGLLPSPFPSLPLSSVEQNPQPTGANSTGPQLPVVQGAGVDSGAVQPGLYPGGGSFVSAPAESHTVSSASHSQKQPVPGTDAGLATLQPSLSQAPHAPALSTITVTSLEGVFSPHAAVTQSLPPLTPGESGSNMYPASQLGSSVPQTHTPGPSVPQTHTQGPSVSQKPVWVPTSPPYSQPNINIQPGEVTVATSSILGPIPALAVAPVPVSTTASLNPTISSSSAAATASEAATSAPPEQPALNAPPPGGLQQKLSGQHGVVSAGISVSAPPHTGVAQTTSNQPAEQHNLPPTVDTASNSMKLDQPTTSGSSTTTIDTAPTHLRPEGRVHREHGEPLTDGRGAWSSSPQVSLQIPQTGPSLQTVALPEIESHAPPQAKLTSTTAGDDGGISVTSVGASSSLKAQPDAFAIVVDTAANSSLSSSATMLPSQADPTLTAASTAFAPYTTPIATVSSILTTTSSTPTTDTAVSSAAGVMPSTGSSLSSTGVATLPPVGVLGSSLTPSVPGVVPLPLTTLGPLSTPLHLEHGAPLATELMLESLATQPQQSLALQQQLKQLQQTLEEQKGIIAAHVAEKEAHTKQEAAYQHQISQLQQQLQAVQVRQEQEKAAATDQQSTLMQLLHQQQDMFSQQQSQMEQLSRQDETHRKEYLHVEERFRESLRIEQEMKVSLQAQILQLTQENQKLNQTLQTQSQQLQALQLQLQQYSVHIAERDRQLVAFKDQHKEIVDKLEQGSRQRVAQLVQRIQELQLQLNQRPREGPPMLPQPLQPTMAAQPPRQNPQQNQDLGPAGLQQPNLPQPMQPNIVPPPVARPPHSAAAQLPLPSGGGASNSNTMPPNSGVIQRPALPVQGPGGPSGTISEVSNPYLLRQNPSQQQQQQSVQTQLVRMPHNVQQPGSGAVPTSQPPQLQQQQSQTPRVPPGASVEGPQSHIQQVRAHPSGAVVGQMRPGSVASPLPASSSHIPLPHSVAQTPTTPVMVGGGGGLPQPTSHTVTPLPQQPSSRPLSRPSLPPQGPYPAVPTQLQPATPGMFHSPANPSLQQVAVSPAHPQHQHQQTPQPRPAVPQGSTRLPPPQQIVGQGIPNMQAVRPATPGSQPVQFHPTPSPAGQPMYTHSLPHGPPGPTGLPQHYQQQHHPQFRGPAP